MLREALEKTAAVTVKNEEKSLPVKSKTQEQLEKLHAVAADPTVDPNLSEYLAAMQPRSQSKTWTNDDALPQPSKPGGKIKTIVDKVGFLW